MILRKNIIIFADENSFGMQYDIIYPQDDRQLHTVPCVIAASYFDADELIRFGVNPEAYEVDSAFVDDNEFEKVFKLWNSPVYLRKFFKENLEYFQQEYWQGITEDEFVTDVTKSLNNIKKEFVKLFSNHDFHKAAQPLDPDEEDLRLYRSIRVKVKQGKIRGHFAFRFYAVEVEENKCYLMTGATIKIHKDMLKAPNTTIEMKKLEFALNELSSAGIETKELFLDYIL